MIQSSGWCYGLCVRTTKRGDFPAECVYILPTMTRPPPDILVLYYWILLHYSICNTVTGIECPHLVYWTLLVSMKLFPHWTGSMCTIFQYRYLSACMTNVRIFPANVWADKIVQCLLFCSVKFVAIFFRWSLYLRGVFSLFWDICFSVSFAFNALYYILEYDTGLLVLNVLSYLTYSLQILTTVNAVLQISLSTTSQVHCANTANLFFGSFKMRSQNSTTEKVVLYTVLWDVLDLVTLGMYWISSHLRCSGSRHTWDVVDLVTLGM